MIDVDLAHYRSARPSADEAYGLLACSDWRALAPLAGELRDAGWGRHVTYSRKVFVPLTQLCRDVCHYCTFAPRRRDALEKAFLTPDDVLAIARAGAHGRLQGSAVHARATSPRRATRRRARRWPSLGHESTLSYLREVAAARAG